MFAVRYFYVYNNMMNFNSYCDSLMKDEKINVNQLWKLLIDRDIMKKDLRKAAGISTLQWQNLENAMLQ